MDESMARVSAEQLCFAVYASFGDDLALARFPDGEWRDLAAYPLVRSLHAVAAQGVPVLLLIDRPGEDSQLVDIPAGEPGTLRVESRWKLDMAAPSSLMGLLQAARARHPQRRLVLAMEGHGCGYLPAVDKAGLLALAASDEALAEWRCSGRDQAPFDETGQPLLKVGVPSLTGAGPVLPAGGPVLATGGPFLPLGHTALPTHTLKLALAGGVQAGEAPLVAIHFASCFSMSVEVLHTVAPYAQAASGYCNDNFFNAGAAYPAVFERLTRQGAATAEELAAWFVEEHHALLSAQGRQPIVGGALALSRMGGIADAVDALADSLLAAMGDSRLPPWAVRCTIQAAIADTQHYDTSGDLRFDGPDQLTDLYSLADALRRHMADWPQVLAAAEALCASLQGIKRVGDVDSPWMDASGQVIWNFSAPTLAMNIFLPDPLRSGYWDWRAPFYFDINPGPGPARLQSGVIEFLKGTNWVAFLAEYHRETPFRALSVPRRGRMPLAAAGGVQRLSEDALAQARTQARAPRRAAPLGPIGLHARGGPDPD